MQFCLYLVVCAVRAQSVFSWEPGLSVASLLDGQAVFAESVSGQGFPQFWVGHDGQVFCLKLNICIVIDHSAWGYSFCDNGCTLSGWSKTVDMPLWWHIKSATSAQSQNTIPHRVT